MDSQEHEVYAPHAMKTHPLAQTLGFFDVELRVSWLEGSL